MKITFENNKRAAVHSCESRREGDWIIYTCPQCPDYERRHHLGKGEMIVEPARDPSILHQGGLQHVTPELLGTTGN